MNPQGAAVEQSSRRTAAERFSEQLRALRTAVGNPSFRAMAGRSGQISHTTLHEAAAGTRFPSWETTREFVRACGSDEAQWRRRWEDAQRADAAPAAAGGLAQPTDNTEPTPVAVPHGCDTTAARAVTELVVVPAAETPGSAVKRVTPRRRWRWRWLVAATTAVAVVVVVARADTAAKPPTTSSVSASTAAGDPSAPLLPGDASRFVADITVPDGTRVKANSHFVKVWAIANTGTVGWHNRFLARMHPLGENEICRTPDRVPIGDTLPGNEVMISVPVVTGNRPGRCWVGWKMVDERGQMYFPSRRPVFFLVHVTR